MTIGVALMMAPLQSRICTGVGKLGIKYRGVQGGQKGESGIRLYMQSGSATHVTSQVLQPKSVNKWYRGRHTFISVHIEKDFTDDSCSRLLFFLFLHPLAARFADL